MTRRVLERVAPAPLLGLGVLVALPFLTGGYQIQQLGQYLLFAALAVSLDMVWGYGGVLSLGHAAFFGLGAYAMALFETRTAVGGAIYIGLAAGAAVGCAAAVALGWFVFRGGVAGAYLSILTLAVSLLLEQVALRWSSLTGGFNGIFNVSPFSFDQRREYWIALAGFLVVYVAARLVLRSPFGRVVMATRDNPQRTTFFGYDVGLYQIVTFAISGAMAGFAGALYAQAVGFVSPTLLGFVLSTQVAIWVALGGRGTLAGPALGAIAVNWAQDKLSASLLDYYLLVLGTIFILVVIFFQSGVWPWLDAGIRRLWPVRAAARVRELQVVEPVEAEDAPTRVPALETRDMRKAFKSLNVVTGVDLSVPPNALHCLVGPNGAGKTTLLNLMTGALRPDAGDVFLFGERVTGLRSHQIARRGVGRKFQAPTLFPSLSIADNLLVAAQGPTARWPRLLAGRVSAGVDLDAVGLLRANGLGHRLAEPAAALAHGQQQWLELCMVLASRPRLLLLDEPTAGLTAQETVEAARVIESVARRRNLTALVVEHDMEFVRTIADAITVLHRGAVLAEGSLDEVRANVEVREVYLGAAV